MMDTYVWESACIKSEKWKENKMKSSNTQRTETQDCAENRSNERDLLKQHDTLSYLTLLLASAGVGGENEEELSHLKDAPSYLIHLLGKAGIEIEDVEGMTPLVAPVKIKCDSKIADKISTSCFHNVEHINDNVFRISLLDMEYPLDTGPAWVSWLIKNEIESPTTKAITWMGAIIEARYLRGQECLT
jgi:hypothetical protein